MMDFSDFTEDDIEMAVELGQLVREDGRRETREFLRSALSEEETGAESEEEVQ